MSHFAEGEQQEGWNILPFVDVTSRNRNGQISGIGKYPEGYIDYINHIKAWAEELGCRSDNLEYFMYRSNRETGKGVTLHMLNKSVSRKGPVSFRLKDAYEFLNKRELDWAASWIEKLRKPDDFSENNFRNVKQGKCIEIIWQKDLWGTFVNSIWPEGITGVTKAGIRGHGTGGRYKHWSNELDEHLRRNCGEPLWQLSDPEWFNIIETL